MKSQASPRFWKLYMRLPLDVQRQARKAYRTFKANPRHPSLHFKRVDDEEPIHSARVSGDYRVLGVVEGDAIVWFWIGDHGEYERLLKNV